MKPIFNALLVATAVVAMTGAAMAQNVGQSDTGTSVTGTTTMDSDTTGTGMTGQTGTDLKSQLDSDQAELLEKTLDNRGYSIGSVDGVIDSQTEAALREFQEANGLAVTGTVNNETVAELGIKDQLGTVKNMDTQTPDDSDMGESPSMTDDTGMGTSGTIGGSGMGGSTGTSP